MAAQTIQLHLFDLDGTLTDSRAGLFGSFRAGLAAIGRPHYPDAALVRFLGTPLPIVFRTVRPEVTPPEIELGIRAFRAHYDQIGIHGNCLYPDVREMLTSVRNAGRRVWIVTSKPEMHAIRVIGLLGIDALVDGTVGAGLNETDTKTELVARALSAAHVPAAEALMLGDRHYDMIGARENNVEAVGALWGYGSKAELEQAGCRRFARTPDEFRLNYVGPAATSPSRSVVLG